MRQATPLSGDLMSKLAFAACLALLLVADLSSAQTPGKLTVIRAGTLIDGTSDASRRNQLVFVRGDRIEEIADGSAQIPADAKVVDLSSSTVLPGLIDSHTHIFLLVDDPAHGGSASNIC